MRTSETWICVADGTRAQFYLCDGAGHDIVPTLDYMLAAPSRAHNFAMTTDRPGRAFPSAGWGETAGGGRHASAEGAWPDEASDADTDQQTVTFRALVQADGSVEAVKILSDPGQGFGAAAQKCLIHTTFQPAKDRHGQATRAWSMAIRVHFVR